ncbi:MAG: cardiolipin synthase [Rhodospirillales bacterium 69-11]|nr:cardiolipin synthase [Rhodospirillales bacterium]OJW27553.1 MAG: cardiolipin synthase [Rhodospirillales bacterium 69-11]
MMSDVRVHVTLVAGFVLAIGASLHILLNKRDVASAVGWIGLVWLAPFLGVATYLVFGINRVRRRARQARAGTLDAEAGAGSRSLEVPDGLAPLGRGVGRITGAPLVRAAAVGVFHNGDEAYPPMLAAIEAAQHSVGLSSYIFRNDEWGGRFIEALTAAHRRGVAVRVLIDGIGGGWLFSPAYHRLRRAGVPAARFMHSPLPWRMPFINLRCHKKILVVDGVLGFTGGLNIGDENVLATRPRHPVQDMHFRIEGQVVGQLTRAFAADWQFATGEDLLGAAWFPGIEESDGVLARVIDSGPDEDIEKIEFAVLQAVACARRSVRVMTPYFLPEERLVTALALAAMRGVAVEVVLPAHGNHVLVDWASRANVGPLLEAGVRLTQSPPPFHHAKLMVVDEAWCLIGSCNWDIRSFRLNFELCMELYDDALARVLAGVMAGARGAALTQADIAARPLPVKLRDAAARLMLPYL